MKTTGSWVALSWLRMNAGFSAMVLKRKASDPSGAPGPKASGGSVVVLQHTPTRSHELIRRRALGSYLGECIETPTNWLSLLLQKGLISTLPPEALRVKASWPAMSSCS